MTTSEDRDHELEAEGWKKTARKWRRRAIKGWSGWRAKAKAIAEVLAERDSEIEESERETQKLHGEIKKMKREHEAAIKKISDVNVPQLKSRLAVALRDAGSLARRISELQLVIQNKDRMLAQKEDAPVIRRQVLPARARLRVLATRLGFDPSSKGYADDEWLLDRMDRLLVKMIEECSEHMSEWVREVHRD